MEVDGAPLPANQSAKDEACVWQQYKSKMTHITVQLRNEHGSVMGNAVKTGGVELELTLHNADDMELLSNNQNPRKGQGLLAISQKSKEGDTAAKKEVAAKDEEEEDDEDDEEEEGTDKPKKKKKSAPKVLLPVPLRKKLTTESSHTFKFFIALMSSDISHSLIKIKVAPPNAADDDPLCVVTRAFRSRARSNKTDHNHKKKLSAPKSSAAAASSSSATAPSSSEEPPPAVEAEAPAVPAAPAAAPPAMEAAAPAPTAAAPAVEAAAPAAAAPAAAAPEAAAPAAAPAMDAAAPAAAPEFRPLSADDDNEGGKFIALSSEEPPPKFRGLGAGDEEEGGKFRSLSAGDEEELPPKEVVVEEEEEEEEDDDDDDDDDDEEEEEAGGVLASADSDSRGNQARKLDQLQLLLSGLENRQPMPSGPELLEALRMCRIGG